MKTRFQAFAFKCSLYRYNVDAILMCGGVEPLVRFLGERKDPDLQANAAGAIQSICFQEKGRTAVRDLDGVPAMLRWGCAG